MKHHLPSLDALKAFESAARHLSFSLAAQELCITKGAVSYQVRKLGESLDCALFRRAVRQVYLTDAGQQLLQTSQKIFDALTRTFEQIKPGGRLIMRSGTPVSAGPLPSASCRNACPAGG